MLLILAGVTITMLTGQDSTPQKAVEARTENERGAAKDAAALLVSGKIQEYYEEKYVKGTTSAGTILEYLEGELTESKGETTDEGYQVVVEEGEITVSKGTETIKGEVSSDGIITWSGSAPASTASKIGTTTITKENVKQYLGTKVAKDSNNIEYALYYVDFDGDFGDEGTVYLKALTSVGSTKLNGTLATENQAGAVSRMRQVNPDWSTNNAELAYGSFENREKGAAYLCDENNSLWSGLKAQFETKYTGKVNYVIGAPSVEMFAKAINQAGGLTGDGAVDARWFANKVSGDATTSKYTYSGYLCSVAGKNTTSNANYDYYKDLTSTQQAALTTAQKQMYYSNTTQWLASPKSDDADYVVGFVNSRGTLNGFRWNYSFAACPLVSLRSGVELTELTSE